MCAVVVDSSAWGRYPWGKFKILDTSVSHKSWLQAIPQTRLMRQQVIGSIEEMLLD
jgi:hypothetical protein